MRSRAETSSDDAPSEVRFIAAMGLLSGAAGMVPPPLLAEVLIGGLRRAMVIRLAQRREVVLPARLVGQIAGGTTAVGHRRLREMVTRALLPRWGWRRLARSLLLISRIEDATETFLLGVYFDRYLCQHHRGSLDEVTAARLHGVVRLARERLVADLLGSLFRQGLASILQRGASASARLLELATATASTPAGAVAGAPPGWEEFTPLARAAHWVESQLYRLGRLGLLSIEQGFDQAWAAPVDR